MMKKIHFFVLALWSSASFALPVCTKTGNVITDTRECTFQPDTYKMTVHKIGLCSALPSAPTTTQAGGFSSCSTIFQNDAGSEVTLTDTSTIVGLSGTNTRPENGAYTYTYLIISPTVSMATDVTFDNSRTARKQMSTDGTGTTCWTTDSDLWRYTDNNSEVGRASFNYVACGSSTTARGTHRAHFNSFKNQGVFHVSTDLEASGGFAYLVTSDYKLASTAPSGRGNWGDVSKILVYMPISNATIDDSTSGMRLKINNSQGARIKGSGTGNTHTSNDQIQYLSAQDVVVSYQVLSDNFILY